MTAKPNTDPNKTDDDLFEAETTAYFLRALHRLPLRSQRSRLTLLSVIVSDMLKAIDDKDRARER